MRLIIQYIFHSVSTCTQLWWGMPTLVTKNTNIPNTKFNGIALRPLSTFMNSLSKPCTRCIRNVVWAWHTSTCTHCHTQPSRSQSNAYFDGISLECIPCGFGSIALGCCPSMLLQSQHESSLRVKIFVWIISLNGWKFTKYKTRESCAYQQCNICHCILHLHEKLKNQCLRLSRHIN